MALARSRWTFAFYESILRDVCLSSQLDTFNEHLTSNLWVLSSYGVTVLIANIPLSHFKYQIPKGAQVSRVKSLQSAWKLGKKADLPQHTANKFHAELASVGLPHRPDVALWRLYKQSHPCRRCGIWRGGRILEVLRHFLCNCRLSMMKKGFVKFPPGNLNADVRCGTSADHDHILTTLAGVSHLFNPLTLTGIFFVLISKSTRSSREAYPNPTCGAISTRTKSVIFFFLFSKGLSRVMRMMMNSFCTIFFVRRRSAMKSRL